MNTPVSKCNIAFRNLQMSAVNVAVPIRCNDNKGMRAGARIWQTNPRCREHDKSPVTYEECP